MNDTGHLNLCTSQTIAEIAKALAEAQKHMKPIVKDETARAQAYSYRYADLATVLDAVRPALNAQGIAIVQACNASAMNVSVTTRLIHVSGEWFESTLDLEAESSGPQKIGSALSYARRYSLLGMVGAFPKEEDDDAAAAMHDRKAPQTQPAPRRATPEPRNGPAASQGPVSAAVGRMAAAQGNVVQRMAAGIRWLEGRNHGPTPIRVVLAKVIGRTIPEAEDLSLSLKEIEALEAHIAKEEEREDKAL